MDGEAEVVEDAEVVDKAVCDGVDDAGVVDDVNGVDDACVVDGVGDAGVTFEVDSADGATSSDITPGAGGATSTISKSNRSFRLSVVFVQRCVTSASPTAARAFESTGGRRYKFHSGTASDALERMIPSRRYSLLLCSTFHCKHTDLPGFKYVIRSTSARSV